MTQDNRIGVVLLAVFSLGLVALLVPAQQPPSIFTTQRHLERIRDELNVTLMRQHGWKKLQEIAVDVPVWSPTGSLESQALWETWPQTKTVFAPECGNDDLLCKEATRTTNTVDSFAGVDWRIAIKQALALESPPQLQDDDDNKTNIAPQHLLQSVHFNGAACRHIREERLHDEERLTTLRRSGYKFIEPLSAESITVKAVWWPIHQEGITVVPVWDGLPVPEDNGWSEDALRHGFNTWPRLVGVTTVGEGQYCTVVPRPECWTGGSRHPPAEVSVEVLPVTQFYIHPVSAKDLSDAENRKALNSLFERVLRTVGPQPEWSGPVSINDVIALVGLHVATKEIDDWVWMTFWWHDKPDVGPFAADRPLDMKGRWSNYVMDITFSAWTPREQDGSLNITFNPWLEGAMINGVKSNCVVCHQRSAWCMADDGNYVTQFPKAVDDHDFDDFEYVRTDYLWSILRQVRGKDTSCPKYESPTETRSMHRTPGHSN